MRHLPLLAILLVPLSGCFGGASEPTATLMLNHLTQPPSSTVVNVTQDLLNQYPVIEALLAKWQAGNGTFAGVSEEYDFKDALEIINDLQLREPSGFYRASTVNIAFGSEYFELAAVRSVTERRELGQGPFLLNGPRIAPMGSRCDAIRFRTGIHALPPTRHFGC